MRVVSETLQGWLPTPETLLAELAGVGLRTQWVAGDVARLVAS